MYHDFGHGCNRKWITCRVQNMARWQILLYSCTGSLRLCRVVTDIMRLDESGFYINGIVCRSFGRVRGKNHLADAYHVPHLVNQYVSLKVVSWLTDVWSTRCWRLNLTIETRRNQI